MMDQDTENTWTDVLLATSIWLMPNVLKAIVKGLNSSYHADHADYADSDGILFWKPATLVGGFSAAHGWLWSHIFYIW